MDLDFDLEAFADVVDVTAADPVSAMRWAPWQREFLSDRSPRRLMRGANRIGKTAALMGDIVHDIRGTNPWRPRTRIGPMNCLLIGESVKQMARSGGPLEMLWDMIPAGEIDPKLHFERGYGIRGAKEPVIPIVRGPGAGCVIEIATYAQAAKVLAGFKAHRVDCDEPCPEPTYGELAPRILGTGGIFTIGFTPVIGMPEQTWLRKFVEDGVFREFWIPLTVDAVWPEGNERPRLTQEEIDEFTRVLPEVERGLRLRAEWDAVVLNRWLSAYSSNVVHDFGWQDIPAGTPLVVGVDHGLKAGKQAAALVAVADPHGMNPRVWVVDETQEDGYTKPEQDAAAILTMLARNGLTYLDVDHWVGDRQTGDGLILKSKTNTDLLKQLVFQASQRWESCRALTLRSPEIQSRKIALPNKWNGSLAHGMKLLNGIIANGNMHIHPRCPRTAKAMETWKGDPYDPVKDILDAVRYSIEHVTDAKPSAKVYGRRA